MLHKLKLSQRLGDKFATNSRTGVILINTLCSLLLKGSSILVNFMLVPLCIKAINEREYGMILTITSVMTWIAFMDIGIGNGLRNKLSAALAEKNYTLGRQYVSTAYYYITLIFGALLLIYTCIHPFINWYSLLNIPESAVKGLPACIFLVIVVFIIRFIFQLISVILLADQKNYISDAIMPIANLLCLLSVYALYEMRLASFYTLIAANSIFPIAVLAAMSALLFRGKYRNLRPALGFVNHALRKDLLNTGTQFFLIQICVIIIFSTSEFLVANLFSVADVTRFNIVSKYFGIVFILANMIMNPLWSAFSIAWHQKDLGWIRTTIRRMNLLNLGFLGINILLFFLYNPLIELWIGKPVQAGFYFAAALIIYNAQMIFNNVYAMLLNSIGKLKLQLITGIAGAIINIPLTIVLARYTSLGLSSICLANIISLLPSTVVLSLQCHNILRKAEEAEDTEIWNNEHSPVSNL